MNSYALGQVGLHHLRFADQSITRAMNRVNDVDTTQEERKYVQQQLQLAQADVEKVASIVKKLKERMKRA